MPETTALIVMIWNNILIYFSLFCNISNYFDIFFGRSEQGQADQAEREEAESKKCAPKEPRTTWIHWGTMRFSPHRAIITNPLVFMILGRPSDMCAPYIYVPCCEVWEIIVQMAG
jgi:hypothetical protein